MPAAYLYTRVSLFATRRWQPGQFEALLTASHDAVPELLARQGLPELGVGYDGRDPRSLEARLVARVLDETLILLRALNDEARRFIVYWTQRFELSNVKTLIRAKMAGERPADIGPRLLAMGPFARLDMDDLMQVEDASELLRRLERSPYAEIARHARDAFAQSHDPFILDATLDRAYFEGLVRRARPLQQSLGRPFRDLMADLIDRVNLVWLMRYRFNYGLPPAQVYYLLVASGYRLNPAMLQKLVAQQDPAGVLASLPDPLAQLLVETSDIPGIAQRLEATAAERAARVLAGSTAPLARAFAYLLLRERDLRGVRAVLRGRLLQLPLPAIRQALGATA